MNYDMDEDYTVKKIKQRIYDQATRILLNEVQMSVKYANIVMDVTLQFHSLYIPPLVNTYNAKLKLSSLDLETERGRYYNI